MLKRNGPLSGLQVVEMSGLGPAPAPRFSHTKPDMPTIGETGFVSAEEILDHWRQPR